MLRLLIALLVPVALAGCTQTTIERLVINTNAADCTVTRGGDAQGQGQGQAQADVNVLTQTGTGAGSGAAAVVGSLRSTIDCGNGKVVTSEVESSLRDREEQPAAESAQ